MFTEAPSRVIYCYYVFQKLFTEMAETVPTISFYQGLPDRATIETWASKEKHLMLVFDDLYQELIQSKAVCDLTIMLSHHLNISCIMTSHNIFMCAKYSKTISTNLLPVPGRPTFWMIVEQGPIMLAVGGGGGCLVIFTLLYLFSSLSPSLWRGGRVVRWSWVNFQCRGVLFVWIRVGQGPTALAVGAGGGCLDIFTLIYPFSSFSFSLGDDPI